MDYTAARGWLESLGEFHMEFGLDRVRAVLSALGNPERHIPAIHVAGTNGKGMTCAFAASILRHAGVKVGLYTSPHLSRPNERIAILGKPIHDAAFASAITRVRGAVEGARIPLTYFEAITCAAFAAFEDAGVQAMVIEVGLGGRLDATNVIDPVASVITSISLDHTAILGGTIEEIAAEKAGIVKPGRPVVIPADELELGRILDAKGAGGRIWLCGSEVGWEPGLGAGGIRLPGDPPGAVPVMPSPFVSSTRNKSAALAAVAARLFDATLGHAVIYAGLEHAAWPGRNEHLSWTDPIGFVRRVTLDGGHNPAAAASVARELLPAEGGHVLFFAAMADKDFDGILRALARHSFRAIVCTSAGTARSATSRQLAAAARTVFGDRVPLSGIEPIDDAFEEIGELFAGEKDTPMPAILVTGSLYLVGRVREIVTGGPPTEIG